MGSYIKISRFTRLRKDGKGILRSTFNSRKRATAASRRSRRRPRK